MDNDAVNNYFSVLRKKETETDLFKFMTVLKWEVWVSILAAIIIIGVIVWILEKISPYSAVNHENKYDYECR
jgi:chromate transport protein ChrA